MDDERLTVTDGLVVSLDYSLSLEDDNNVVDSSEGGEPLEFIQGEGQIITGLEAHLYGMSVGEEKDVVVGPTEAYGDVDPEAFQQIALDNFPQDMVVEPGMALQLQDDRGNHFQAYVAEVSPEGVLLDFNHPLAGRTLHFKVKIAGLRPATAEERAHGHVHGAGHDHGDEGYDEVDDEE
jgi:FKBP-type peptidyl-prolyl cis-trans isomerase SlyD